MHRCIGICPFKDWWFFFGLFNIWRVGNPSRSCSFTSTFIKWVHENPKREQNRGSIFCKSTNYIKDSKPSAISPIVMGSALSLEFVFLHERNHINHCLFCIFYCSFCLPFLILLIFIFTFHIFYIFPSYPIPIFFKTLQKCWKICWKC